MELFRDILSFDSTSGRERPLGEWLAAHLEAPSVETFEVGDGTLDVLLRWGDEPRVVFCSHMDTVPPYIPPTFLEDRVTGRGTCDAKGQFYAMYRACQRLAAAGRTGFALLIVSGEETGSWGAKAFAKLPFRAPLLVVGEPTDNCMVSASKGTKRFDLTFTGRPFHSGYPEHGLSAVELFVDFMERLRAAGFPDDPDLGPTTWNVGQLHSDNPQNILSPSLTCRLYFRTTFASDAAVVDWMRAQAGATLSVREFGGDAPARYHTLPGFPAKPVSFGSDAPHLTNFGQKVICGPGSITVAHRDDEFLAYADLEQAITNYVSIFEHIAL
ncbi:MAG: M20/M25/M40 family metallo-hydrolase [Bacteroidales bacterium]|nr:M20/M25/M40 family metallo-hydrolase [Bacteroidales bacterium]MBR1577241.1 M20/M25/M40 family metallo-hydrolase [Bacteroidales bacterium]